MDLLDAALAACGNVRQLTVLQNGKPVYERCLNSFKQGDTLHVMSVTKSIVSLLIGIAHDRGLFCNIDQPILDFFPDYTIKRGEKTIQTLTVRHLLTMTAPYKYRSEPWTRVCSSDDWTIAALDLLGGKTETVGTFRYSTLGIHILNGILARITGKQTTEFANEALFSKIGASPVRGYLANTAEEHRAFMLSKEPKEPLWFVDPHGVAAAGYGLCLSAADLAKIGQLCLNGGVFGGETVVSAAWLRESCTPCVQCDESFGCMKYGYLWWIPDDTGAYAALGNGGNTLYIDPARHTVVAITAVFKGGFIDRISFIRRTLYPALSL